MARSDNPNGPRADAGSAVATADADPGLAQLRRREFGSGIEYAIRVLLILAAAIGVRYLTGTWNGFVWAAAYFASQALAWVALTRPPPYDFRRTAMGYGAYMLTSTVFVALPLWLMTSADPALAYCGAMGMIAGAIFTLWREETPDALLPFDAAIGCVALGVGLYATWEMAGTWGERALMMGLTLVAAGYFTAAVVTARATQARLKRAAARGAEAQKMEALGRLSGGIAHDFNNILTVLQGNLELSREIDDPLEKARIVEEALAASKRASGLVAQLLSFAQRAPLSPARLEAGAVITDLAQVAARVLPATITVSQCTPPGVVHVSADPDRLMTALLNLVINARDAMSGRGRLALWADIAGADRVVFGVGDDGPGMSPETVAQATDPFFTTKPLSEGSGLGLSMAKGFAEQSGGALQIESGESGTRVVLILPRDLTALGARSEAGIDASGGRAQTYL